MICWVGRVIILFVHRTFKYQNMKTRKQKPEIPENIPVITTEMMEKTAIEIAKRRAGKKSPVLGFKDTTRD